MSKYLATTAATGQLGAQSAPGDVILIFHAQNEFQKGDVAISVSVEVSYDLSPGLFCLSLIAVKGEVLLEFSDAELVVPVPVEKVVVGCEEILELHSLLAVHGGLQELGVIDFTVAVPVHFFDDVAYFAPERLELPHVLSQTTKYFVLRKFTISVSVKLLEKLLKLFEVSAWYQLRQNVLMDRLLENVVLLVAVNVGHYSIIEPGSVDLCVRLI